MLPASLTRYFHPAGRMFILAFACVTFLFLFISSSLFILGVILTFWCAYFFRDPQRVTPMRSGLIVSPADGKVVMVKLVHPDIDLGFGEEERMRISIFLNVFDVHVNRMPADGIVKACRYRAGKFLNASLDKASKDNERMATALELTGEHPFDKQILGVVQIAGLIARRIVCDAREGSAYKAGQRYGIIRFGSRVDIYLPHGVQPMVNVGQYMIGGETVLADCTSTEPQRRGETR